MEKVLVDIYDLRRYRDNLVKEVLENTGDNFEKHEPSFTSLGAAEIKYLDNMDIMRAAATKYATGKLQTSDSRHIAAVKEYVKMEMLDLSIRNERVALLDEITRAHCVLNNKTSKAYPEARFVYPETLNAYTPYINVLKKDSI